MSDLNDTLCKSEASVGVEGTGRRRCQIGGKVESAVSRQYRIDEKNNHIHSKGMKHWTFYKCF